MTRLNPYETKTIADVLAAFKVQASKGLSLAEIEVRQSTYGLNEVPEERPSMLLLFGKHFWGLTAFMLEITIFISFLLEKYADVYIVSGLMVFNAVVGFMQERKATMAIRTLKTRLQVMVRVLRGGQWGVVAGVQLVPGDIIRIRTGDFTTADAKLISGRVAMDQSALTGESASISKQQGNIVYAGSAVKSGECTAVVVGTGVDTFFGKAAQLVGKAKPRLHMEEVVAGVVKILFLIVLIFLGCTLTISLVRGEAFLDVLPLLLILLVSAVPVALPAMFSVSMANGYRQLAEKGILVSRLAATEDAGTMTTLCIDKTGTLTQNKLSVEEIIAADACSKAEVLQYGVLASVAANNDPVDMAFVRKAEDEKIIVSTFRQVSFTPFTATLQRTEALVEYEGYSFKVLKGAYPTIKGLCLDQQTGFDEKVEEWGSKGFKTIAVAIERAGVIQLVGIVALMDPPFADSAGMIAQIIKWGVSVKMLTGDALPVARETAEKVGIGANITTADLLRNEPDPKRKLQLILSHDGFAGVLPEDKFDIIEALQQHREVTGMTGDGVNDAPALKQAEVGIAVTGATDVARQSASVILLREGLRGVVDLLSVGRSIHLRIHNWVISKISKTLFTVVFVCAAYLFTGGFVVDAFDMVLLLLIVDFVTLTLSTEPVSASDRPGNWAMKPMITLGFSLGLLTSAEALGWFFFGRHYFKISTAGQIHSLSFAILFFSSIVNLLIVRTPARFYRQPIGKILLSSILGDMILSFVMLAVGVPGFASLPLVVTVGTLFYFLLCGLVLNDWIKTRIVAATVLNK